MKLAKGKSLPVCLSMPLVPLRLLCLTVKTNLGDTLDRIGTNEMLMVSVVCGRSNKEMVHLKVNSTRVTAEI
jgi:hypothetical protein